MAKKKTYTYVIKTHGVPLTFEEPLNAEQYAIGETIEDYEAGKFILLGKAQLAFYAENTNVSAGEILRCELNIPIEYPPIDPTYEELVIACIRERYNQNEAEAIMRKRIAGTDNGEFDTFDAYCEECKNRYKDE